MSIYWFFDWLQYALAVVGAFAVLGLIVVFLLLLWENLHE